MRLETVEHCLPLRGRWLRYLFYGLGFSLATAQGPPCRLAQQYFFGYEGKRGQVSWTKLQISAFRTAIDLYILDNGRAPTTQQGLDALLTPPTVPPLARKWVGPYLKDVTQVPLDPWNNPYQYRLIDAKQSTFLIQCYGSDGVPGGTGEAADLIVDWTPSSGL